MKKIIQKKKYWASPLIVLGFMHALGFAASSSVSQKAIYEPKKVVIDLPPHQLSQETLTFDRGQPKEVGLYFSRFDLGEIVFSSRMKATEFKPIYFINGGLMTYTHVPWVHLGRYELRTHAASGFFHFKRSAKMNLGLNAQKDVEQNLFAVPVKLGLENRYLMLPAFNISAFLQLNFMPVVLLTSESSIADDESHTALTGEASLGLLWKYEGYGIDLRVNQIVGSLEKKSLVSTSLGLGLRAEL